MSKELTDLLHYMKQSTCEMACNGRLAHIHNMVEDVKQRKEVQKEYMDLHYYINTEIQKGREEMREEIREEVREEMREEMREEERINTLREKERADRAEEKATRAEEKATLAEKEKELALARIAELEKELAQHR